MNNLNTAGLMAAFLLFTFMVQVSGSASEENVRPRLSTDEVENQITLDREVR